MSDRGYTRPMRWSRIQDLLKTAERHITSGRFGRAITFYRKVLVTAQQGDSEWELAHVRLGDLHLGLGQIQPAIAHLLRARALQPDEMEYALMLGRALRLGQRPLAAQYHLFDALDSLHHRVDACLEMALLMEDCGRRTEARAYAQIALRFAPLREEIRELLTRLADA